MRYLKIAIAVILIAWVGVLLIACAGGSKAKLESSVSTPLSAKSSEVLKPKPIVVTVTAASTGLFENYYALVDISIRNEGADGMIIVIGSITQGGKTIKNELPIYIANNTSQKVRLIFPLLWRGGDWTPTVQTEIP